MIQFFFIPVVVVDVGGIPCRVPKYLAWSQNPSGLNVQRSVKDYGSINNVMVVAVNAAQADLDFLAAQPDVYAWPIALDENMTAQERSSVEAFLEAQFIPANWLSPSDTRRSALRTVTGMYLYMQRLTATSGQNPLDWGITLNTQFRNLTAEQQQMLQGAALSLGYAWNVGQNDTMRNILKEMADQWGMAPILFGFVTL